jgi:hypothetical protein
MMMMAVALFVSSSRFRSPDQTQQPGLQRIFIRIAWVRVFIIFQFKKMNRTIPTEAPTNYDIILSPEEVKAAGDCEHHTSPSSSTVVK